MSALALARRYLGEARTPIAFDVVGAVPDPFEPWATSSSDASSPCATGGQAPLV